MPQDTTIYWDGKGPIPALIDSLPDQSKQIVLRQIQEAREYKVYKTAWQSNLYFLLVMFVVVIALRRGLKKLRLEDGQSTTNELQSSNSQSTEGLTYSGNNLQFSVVELHHILTKRFPFFVLLNPFEKEKFINRLQQFIAHKTFVIHDTSGFKEMPVLISAAAIQLSFGLVKFLLPGFEFIHIFPEEFIGVHPSIRVLEGNVSGNSINLSWKHFLHGFQYPGDGQNVGLHEMAHAYYYQYFETSREVDKNFVAAFADFTSYGNKVFEQEALPGFDLYSDYALRNFQEFWAESIEIFFEKPFAMKMQYPELYSTICIVLNQDPARKIIS